MNVSSTLLLSLKQEIHILNKLIEDIPKSHEDEQLKSWFVPSKPHDFIRNIVCSKNFKDVSYQNCLEITLDRLYVIIRLLTFYIDNCDLARSCKEDGLIVPPSRLSLGYCVKLLYARIVVVMEKKATNKTAITVDNDKFYDKKTQTDIISLNKCDSCSSAILCMKNLVNFFDDAQESNERLKIKYKIYDITQFGSMLQVTSSIENSLNTLYKQLHEKKKENDWLKLENENIKTLLQDKDRKVEFFEEEIAILRGKLVNDKQEVLSLRQDINKLTEKNFLIREEIPNLEKIKQNLSDNLHSLNQENQSLKKQNDCLTNNIGKNAKLLSQYVLKLNKKSSILDTEYDLVKCIIDQYEKSINHLNIKLAKLAKHLDKVDLTVKYGYNSMGEVLTDFSKYDGFCVKIKELFTEKLEYIKESYEQPPIINKLKGNPLVDFPKQIEENRNKIKDLENENVKLQQLLVRFKNIKTG